MGVPKRSVSVPEQETHFDCLPLRDHKPPQQTKWQRVQDQRRPRRAAPTSSPSSPRGRSRSSRRLSVSWTQTRTVSCPPVTLLPLSTLLASPFPTVRPKHALRGPRTSQLHTDGHAFRRKDLEVLMMTTPSLRLSMPSKSTAKSTQTCSNTPL